MERKANIGKGYITEVLKNISDTSTVVSHGLLVCIRRYTKMKGPKFLSINKPMNPINERSNDIPEELVLQLSNSCIEESN